EKTNEQRKVKDSGFKNFRDKTQLIYYHITTLEHFNIIFDKENYFYKNLEGIYNGIENKNEFATSINRWLEDYKEATGPEKSGYIYNENDDFKKFYKGYMDVIAEAHKDNNRNNTGKRLHITLESIAKVNFLKKRGPLGYTFNIDQKFLFLLVAIVTKKERIILKKFFEELHLRGVSLDSLSKRKIVEILEKNNLIEKKSDSGEAQYVKPIL
ncbi:MAG: DNA phosphorothioation-dependent restriction protein DptG, partial [Paraclostridium sp.]